MLIPQTISIAAFRTQYGVPPEVQVFQYAGSLDNGGEDLKLARPIAPVGVTVPYVLADKLKYGDSTPWPVPPDGSGPTLQRVAPTAYGNDPANWKTGPNHGNPGIVIAPQRPPVVNAGPDGSVIAGVQFGSSGSFTDINNEQTWTGTVNWGDGSTTPLTVNANKTFNFNHTFINPGTYTVTVTVTDSYPENATDTMQVTVTPSTPPNVNAGADLEVVQADTFSTSGSFSDPDNGQSWAATVDWGDGAGPVALPLNADKSFNLNHVYATIGDYNVTIAVSDNANVIGTDIFKVTVTSNTPPTVIGGPDQVVPEGSNVTTSGSFNDPNPQQHWSGTVNWGDGTPTAPLTLNADKTFNLDHLYPGPGSYNITLTVNDSIGGAGVDTIIASVLPGPRLGTANNDTYILRRDPTGNRIEFYENRTMAQGPNYSIVYGAMGNYTFNGIGGDDTLIIDTTFGNPIPTGGINFNGGVQGAAGDLVQIIGGPGNDAVIIRSTQIQVGSLNITYGGTEQIRFDGNAGDDTLTINNFLNFTPEFFGGAGSNTLALGAGEFDFTDDAAVASPNLNLVANNSAIFGFSASQHLGSLTLNGSSAAFVFADSSATIVTGGLSIAAGATFDLANNNLIVAATAANRDAILASLTTLLRSGRNGGTWDGLGINSSSANLNAAHTTGLAAILNDQGNGTVVQSSFGGEAVNNNSILVKYTYNGDANVDGILNADDYARIDAGFASKSTGYLNGDFNFSGGAPNSDDYFLIDKTFGDQGTPLGTPAAPLAASSEETSAADPLTRTRVQSTRKHKSKHHKMRHHPRPLARPALDVLMPWARR
jgi:PKD repeat protein